MSARAIPRRAARARRRARGMTLIEVMIALLVGTIGLLGALALLGTVIGGGIFSRQATEASVLVQSRLEEVVSLPDVTLAVQPDGPRPGVVGLNGLGLAPPIIPVPGPFTRQETWTTLPLTGLRRITVVVSWNDALERPHTVQAMRDRVP